MNELLTLMGTEKKSSSPVTCLGQTFPDDAARRAHFTALLVEKLKDPEFRKIEGFPIGTDEAILALSDPPYYTACPNPWIADFIAEWEAQKPAKPADYHYHREPFAADVSEGKNDPIYNAHSYHTKVPHKAIMRYILHYTEPGDIVFDGFCGTGMTGVAAQMCGDRDTVLSLGYQVRPDGVILREEEGADGKKSWKEFSKLGARKAVLNDLSPAATFIAYNYNTPVDVHEFEREAKRILKEVEVECGWMYETTHTDGKTKGVINYTVWSDVFVCPDCAKEIIFWDVAVDKEAGQVRDEFPCPQCGANLTKRNMERAWVTKQDPDVWDEASPPPFGFAPDASPFGVAPFGESMTIRQAKQVPVLINYSVGKKRFEKTPDTGDLALIDKIERERIPYWHPTNRMMEGGETRRNDPLGITHIHHFYTKRNLYLLSAIKSRCNFLIPYAWFWVNAALRYLTRMSKIGTTYYFHGGGGAINAGILGTLYIPSFSVENNVVESLSTRLGKLTNTLKVLPKEYSALSCSSTAAIKISNESIDYIFLDPPFGANLAYSELSFLWETWLNVYTNVTSEAIENKNQGKGLLEYRLLMASCFKEAYRVLKPGRWMTVEFSNTQAAVWNTIQSALAEAGFIVANVSALDKKQGSFKAVTTPTAVKQDLVISAYKPNGGFEERFLAEADTEEGVWDFVRTHMKYLPVLKPQGNALLPVPERDPRILYDQMLAYYVRKNRPIPMNSTDFQLGLAQRFLERDGMYFLPDQVAQYDRCKLIYSEPAQLSLYVKDEASAIQWLRGLLKNKPQTFADINPQFMQQLSGWSKNEKQLDLRELLTQNFLTYDGKDPVPEQIHAYLSSNWKDLRGLPKDNPALIDKAKDRWYVPDPNKATDLEKLRERALLKEFDNYLAQIAEQPHKKLKVFRMEAIRTGFKQAWQHKDYQTIVKVAEKIPPSVLEEDDKLLMWYDQAVTRMGEN
ncbi:MAG: site-specific DNA-methyltransferase [Desulfovibrio sp.]|jgi:DNA modification methylase/predicted RNA-binding Zn-ribbon protein involved in translation (DUF1610 family)|nr:site-specific DNA-methyltransferase [Desulfovibrio sp.]